MGDKTILPGVSGASAVAPGSTSTTIDQDDGTESTYHLKWIQWNTGKIPIVMQSINGPCPLIATMNVLLLREKVKLPSMLEQITANQLLSYLGECAMDCVPADMKDDENAILNLEQNIHDAMEILPKLKTGLDVNIRFTGITDFEYTPECVIFDILRIPLFHGWLKNPNSIELHNAIGNQSYNQLVDNIITNKSSADPEKLAKVLMAEEFLESTASQLTQYGLQELRDQIKENEIGILFRNNHFLTLMKRGADIYTLVTDHGYLTEDEIIWETLDNVEGDGRFFNSTFDRVSGVSSRQVPEMNAIKEREEQLVNDYLLALSLKETNELSSPIEGEASTSTTANTNINTSTTTSADENPKPLDDYDLALRLQAEEVRLCSNYTPTKWEQEWAIPKGQSAIDLNQRLPSQTTKPQSLESTSDDQNKRQTGSIQSDLGSRSEDHPRLPLNEQLVLDTSSSVHPSSVMPASQSPNFNSPQSQIQPLAPPSVFPAESSHPPLSTETENSEAQHANALPSPTFDPQTNSRPLSSSSHTHRTSNRRLKSEKNSKDSNCIVS